MFRLRPRIRNYGRYREIIGVLARYGFGELIDRMKIRAYFRIGRRTLFKEPARLAGLSYAERIRLAMEELGPSFIKLGQVLASRPFLIPPELVLELAKLQDEVAPCDFELIEKTIQEEFGKPISELFKEISHEPVASASLAQVHLAVTAEGQDVAVKVLRPDVRDKLSVDMEILKDFAQLLERFIPEVKQYEPVRQVEEFARVTRREVDFYYEARNIDIFRLNFKGDESIEIPAIYRDLSTSRVLTMSVVDGVKPTNADALEKAGYDLPLVAKRGARIVFKMVFEDKFFHADPHPGNLFVVPGNKWAPVDFGMVGQISETTADLLSDLLVAVSRKDARAVTRILATHELLEDNADLNLLESDLTELLYRYYKIPLKEINMKSIIDDAFDLLSRSRIRLPASMSLLAKALGTYEEVGRALYPDLNMIKEAEPYVKKLAFRKIDPQRMSGELLRLIGSLTDFMSEGPGEFKRLSRKILRGELGFIFRHRGLDQLSNDIDRASNRLSFALIMAAIIIGSSLMMTTEIGVKFYGIPVLGIVGYVFAGILGIWLVISIIRSGRL
jgi:ubiquinone biosynthesis protein